MAVHPLAGKPAPAEMLIDTGRLIENYFTQRPDPANKAQLVSFGTSGHRGTSTNATFTEAHIAAITQALVEYRQANGISGPLFLGKDTHALSAPAERTALEVLAANGVEVVVQNGNGFTPNSKVNVSYGYKTPSQFVAGRKVMKHDLLPMVEDQDKYQRVMSAGFGLWIDFDWRKKGWDPQTPSNNYFPPEVFGTSVRTALQQSDKYVWIYSETPRWWSPAKTPVKLPEAYSSALRTARKK